MAGRTAKVSKLRLATQTGVRLNQILGCLQQFNLLREAVLPFMSIPFTTGAQPLGIALPRQSLCVIEQNGGRQQDLTPIYLKGEDLSGEYAGKRLERNAKRATDISITDGGNQP
jgi:hypothetical protein